MKIIALIMLVMFALDMMAAMFSHSLPGVLFLLSVVTVRRIFLVCRCVTILPHRAPQMWAALRSASSLITSARISWSVFPAIRAAISASTS
jgi:hypothetical protein